MQGDLIKEFCQAEIAELDMEHFNVSSTMSCILWGYLFTKKQIIFSFE